MSLYIHMMKNKRKAINGSWIHAQALEILKNNKIISGKLGHNYVVS